jgi:hypothetical protein
MPADASGAKIHSVSGLVFGIAAPILLYRWAQLDVAERGVPYPAGAPLLVAFVALIGVPLFFLRTRSLAQAFLALGKVVLFIAACSVLAAIAVALRDQFVT